MKNISIKLVKEIHSKLLDLNLFSNPCFDCEDSSLFESAPIAFQSYCIEDFKAIVNLFMDLDEIIKDYEMNGSDKDNLLYCWNELNKLLDFLMFSKCSDLDKVKRSKNVAFDICIKFGKSYEYELKKSK